MSVGIKKMEPKLSANSDFHQLNGVQIKKFYCLNNNLFVILTVKLNMKGKYGKVK